jgi:RecA-family ATPase
MIMPVSEIINGCYTRRNLFALTQIPPKQIEWLIENILPLGITGDIFSMPDTGKSSLILSLACAVANGDPEWNSFRIAGGRVAYIGGEKSNDDVWARDLNRTGVTLNEPDRLINYDPSDGLWSWDRREETWKETEAFRGIMAELQTFQPVLVVLDTLSLLAIGSEATDTMQQVKLANNVMAMRERLNCTMLTISHTNQSSSLEKLERRLSYTSRAGSNGYPGRLRWLMALTNLTSDEKTALDIEPIAKIVALAVSKHNEMPQPRRGNMFNPFLFEIRNSGNMELLNIECKTADLAQLMLAGKSKKVSQPVSRQPNNLEVPSKVTSINAQRRNPYGR